MVLEIGAHRAGNGGKPLNEVVPTAKRLLELERAHLGPLDFRNVRRRYPFGDDISQDTCDLIHGCNKVPVDDCTRVDLDHAAGDECNARKRDVLDVVYRCFDNQVLHSG
jgi:hypothetical protein